MRQRHSPISVFVTVLLTVPPFLNPFFSCWRWLKSPALYRLFHNTDMDPEAENRPTKPSPKNGANTDIVDRMCRVNLDDEDQELHDTVDRQDTEQPGRRLVVYPRPHMLRLSKSPLVKPPEGMPSLKDWFGYGFHNMYATAS